MAKEKYKFLPHTGEIKLRIYGKTLSEIFENSALAFCEHVSRGQKINNVKRKKIKLKAEDNESLLYSFFDELIYLLDAKNFVVCSAELKVAEGKLEGEVFGDDSEKYDNLDHMKAATYHEMYVKRRKDGKWEAQVVVDV